MFPTEMAEAATAWACSAATTSLSLCAHVHSELGRIHRLSQHSAFQQHLGLMGSDHPAGC